MVKTRLISTLAFYASLFALAVIALGAYTRLIDAGLGCPDWPGCYGHIVAPTTLYKAWAEMVHRYFAGTLSVLVCCIVILVCLKPYRSRNNTLMGLALVLLVAYQILLGRLTVTLKLLPIIVTQHLLGGFLILAVLWLIYLNNKMTTSSRQNVNSRSFIPWAIVGLLFLFLQISLGAWVSTHYAALSCPDFPFCLNDKSLELTSFQQAFNVFSPVGVNYEGGVLTTAARQLIQMTHRWGALIFTLYMLVLMALSVRRLKQSPALMTSIFVLLGLLFLQVFLGIVNVLFQLPLITAIAHTLVAALILLALITFTFKLTHSESTS